MVEAIKTQLSAAHDALTQAVAADDLHAIAKVIRETLELRKTITKMRRGEQPLDLRHQITVLQREAERALGKGIREGQRRGEIRRRGRHANADINIENTDSVNSVSTPSDFMPRTALTAGGGQAGIYDLYDGIPDETFRHVLDTAKTQADLMRTSIVRKCRALSAPEQPATPKTEAGRKMMDDLTIAVNSLVFIVNDTDPNEIDPNNHRDDIAGILRGIGTIKRFIHKIKEQHGAE